MNKEVDFEGLAHEIFAVAQLLQDEGIEDAVVRIKEVLIGELTTEDEINYIVHYKWQEGAELFFDKLMIKEFSIKDKNCLDKLENRLITILSNTGMEEENLATVQITGITQLEKF